MKSFDPNPWLCPQPVIIVGTYNEDGTPNAMNAAWAGQWDMKEIMISMGNHATTDNLARCEDFTVAFATKDTLVAADYVGLVSGRKQADKVKRAGLHDIKSTHVNAPVFTDFPMTMECRIIRKLYESKSGYYLLAKIVNILVDEAYLAADGKPDLSKMQLITYEPVHHTYIQLGETVGRAFYEGKRLK